ncbi:MAG: hypothetical protein U1G05_14215 [Kiritimatiellia bacterium]
MAAGDILLFSGRATGWPTTGCWRTWRSCCAGTAPPLGGLQGIAASPIPAICGTAGAAQLQPGPVRRYRCLPHQATWVDRDLFRQYGLFDESFGIAMDYEHLARFIDRHPPAYLPRLISMSRGGVSTNAAEATGR